MRVRGYTLLEMLVVIAIIMLLLGMGIGVVAKLGKRNELEATTNAVRALVRRARNAAREERAPALVELDAAAGEVRAQTRETLTLFRFETDQLSGAVSYAQAADDDSAKTQAARTKLSEYDVRGSYFVQGVVHGADSTEGRLGSALEFRRPGSCVMIPDRPSLSPIEGVAVEAWILPAKLEDAIPKKTDDRETRSPELERRVKAAGTPPTATPVRSLQWWDRHPDDPPLFTVVRKGRAFEVAVTAGYALQLAVTGPIGKGETTYVARSEDLALQPDKWARVAIAFDGREASCSVNGIRRSMVAVKGNETQPERLVRDRAALVFSDPDPDRGFAGVIDEVKLSGILRSERVTIPKNIALLAPTVEIAFDALGGLDPLRHAEPVVFWLSDHEEALKTLEPAAPEPGKTVEKKKLTDKEAAEAKGATDRAKLAKFGELAKTLPEGRVQRVAVDLTGIVTGTGR